VNLLSEKYLGFCLIIGHFNPREELISQLGYPLGERYLKKIGCDRNLNSAGSAAAIGALGDTASHIGIGRLPAGA
jgi:hypothetical protein